jgi:hypothetical protein
MQEHYDITGKIGPLWRNREEPEWPMYSYERPAWMLWQAIAGVLNKRGWTEEEIQTWLQSKGARWALDGDLGEQIERLGREYALSLKPWPVC